MALLEEMLAEQERLESGGDIRDLHDYEVNKLVEWLGAVRDIGPLTRDQLLDKLAKAEKLGSIEGHERADALLLAFINDDEVTRRFCKLNEWYA